MRNFTLSKKKQKWKELVPSMSLIDGLIQMAIKIGLWQLTYDGMWYRVNHIESKLIEIYCEQNEECVRP